MIAYVCIMRWLVCSVTERDEMCNLYVMYYTAGATQRPPPAHRHAAMTRRGHPSQLTCSGVDQPDLLTSMPADSDVELAVRTYPLDQRHADDVDDDDQFSHVHHSTLSGPHCHIQGGPAKVKPLTFLLVTFECTGKIQ